MITLTFKHTKISINMQEVPSPGSEIFKYETHNLKIHIKTQYEVTDETK